MGVRWTGMTMLAATLLVFALRVRGDEAPPSLALTPQLRRPIAAGWLKDGRVLAIANRRSGSVSLIDASTLKALTEIPVGRRLSDLAVHPDGRHVLVTDEAADELIVLEYADGTLRPRSRLQVARTPVSIELSADGTQATIAGLWSRRLEFIDLSPLSTDTMALPLRIVRSVPLPFAPRKQLLLSGGSSLLVADAFGGELAIVETHTGRLAARHSLDGHNLRGMALSGDGRTVFVAHQVVNSKLPTTWQNVDLGELLRNVVTAFLVESLLDPDAHPQEQGTEVFLGSVGFGAGDPASLVMLDNGLWLTALAGIGEVAVGSLDGVEPRRLMVGEHPTEILLTPDGARAFVLNTFGDSVTVIDTASLTARREISLGPQPPLTPADRGELLFYNAGLSDDGWMSCHSCHTDGHSHDRLVDTLGDGTYGTPKRTLSLLGTGVTDPWAWNGQMKELHTQVDQSVTSTMQGRPISSTQVSDLVAYLHTLSPAPPIAPAATSDEDQECLLRGQFVFTQRGCAECHIPPLTYTSHAVYDVGLTDEAGHKTFNPPSLRGASQRAHYLHDGRAATLEAVFTEEGHQLREALSDQELADLLRFLRSL